MFFIQGDTSETRETSNGGEVYWARPGSKEQRFSEDLHHYDAIFSIFLSRIDGSWQKIDFSFSVSLDTIEPNDANTHAQMVFAPFNK